MKSFLMLCGAATLALAAAMPAAAQQAPAPAAATQAKPVPVADLVKQVQLPYERFTLPNGLRVLVHTDRKAPIVALTVIYNVGSKFEPAGKTGFAHLFEHLMFYGSENAPGNYQNYLEGAGASSLNGNTWFDRTMYFETVPRPALDMALFMESDRMGYLLGAVTQSVLNQQRGVVQNEKRQGDNRPYGLIQYAVADTLLAGTGYGHTTIGSMADLDAASLDDVKNWFRGHYGPNNAVLVLAGDIDAAQARPLVEKYFGAIARGPDSVTPAVTVPTLPAPKTITLKDRVPTTLIQRLWAVPGLNDPDAAALGAFARVLGGLASSRLDNALVRQEKLAVAVSAEVESHSQLGIFEVDVNVRPGVDPALVNQRLDAIIGDLIAKGPTADEVNRVATGAVVGRISALEGVTTQAQTLAQGELYSGDPLHFKKELVETAALTPERVRAAAQKWLTRPVLQINVVPGARDAYTEAQPPAQAAVAGDDKPAPGTRGAIPAIGDIKALTFPAVERTHLSNGIELVYAHRTSTPITQAVLSFDAGAAADPDGKLGTQALTLSLLDEGTTTMDSRTIAETKERFGAGIGSDSSADRTFLTLNVPSANLGGALDLFADIVERPAFAPAEVERLRAVQLANIAQEMSSPEEMGQRALIPLVYGAGSPYAKLAAGSGDMDAVKALTRNDLVAFHKAWIRPDKAKIFVVSDLPLDQVRAALDARFGHWQGEGAAGVKAFNVAPQQAAPKIVLVDRPDSPQSVIFAGQMTPLVAQDELLPAIVANEVLGGGSVARINLDIREAKHWSYGAYGFFNRLEHAVSYEVDAPVQADKTGETIKAVLGDVAGFLGPQGITPEEFNRVTTGDVRELAGRFESSSATLRAMQMNDMLHRPDDYYVHMADKYRAMTASGLDAAARAALDPGKFVWVVVGDAAKVKPQLDSLGLPVEVIPAAALTGAAGAK